MNTLRDKSSDTSLSQAAQVAGWSLFLMAILGPFANFVVVQKAFVPDDAVATLANLSVATGLFRAGIFSFLIIVLLDVVVAWALYVLLKPVHTGLSLLTAWTRVVYAAIFGAAILNLTEVLPLLDGTGFLSTLPPALEELSVMNALTAFQSGWNLSLIVFSLHLFGLGYLVIRSGYMPNYLGILLIIAFVGYCVDGVGTILFPGYNLTLAMFTFIGEVVLVFWLLIKGRKLEREAQPEIN